MQQQSKKRISYFLLFTFIQLLFFSYMYSLNKDVNVLTVLMLTPTLSVLLTRLITKEGWGNLFLRPNFKKNIRYYLLAWLGIIALAFVGAFCFFLIFPDSFSPLASEFAQENDLTTISGYLANLSMVIPLAVLVNPLGGLLACFGEEFAWRGYLLPHLEVHLGRFKGTLLTNFIWGCWHAPIIWMGFNYNLEHSLLAVLAQIILCMSLGGILSYLFFETKSLWPVILGHASINAIDKFTPQYLFADQGQATNLLLGPNLTGVIGGLGLIIFAIYCYRRFQQKSDFSSYQNGHKIILKNT